MYEALLQPFQLRHLTLRNRVVSTPHAPAYADDGVPGERYQRYHEEKAKGGTGLVMFGGSSTVGLDCPATFGQIDVSDDRVVPHFQSFSERIHRHGAPLICQISHMGRRTRWDQGNWLPPIAPSSMREPEHRSFPKAMEDWDFERVIDDFSQAARRCRDGGLDGVEISINGLHLISQFFSPSVNKREDAYGGSLDNRLRFGIEIFEAVRRQVGDDYIVGARFSVDELLADGLSDLDCREIAIRLAGTGMIDFINTQGGQPSSHASVAINMAGMAFPIAPFLHLASAIKAEVDIPVLQAHRINDVATATRAIEEGHLDLVGLTRPQMADPYLVQKLMEGRPEDIRQCVGANYCIDRIYVGSEALCIQNAATGREYLGLPQIIARADQQRRAVVVGAGPAGLEAARVLAERGHAVTLFEAEEETGGQVRLAAKGTWREALSGIPRWLDAQVRKLGVELRLGARAGVNDILESGADLVVVATGGRPNRGAIKGSELIQTSWDLIAGKIEPAGSLLIFDDQGDHQALVAAEIAAARGAEVEIVTPERAIGPEMGATNFAIHLRELYKKGVILSPDLKLKEVYREGNRLVAVLENEYTQEEEERLVEQIVAEHGTLPEDTLYFELKPHSSNLGAVDYPALVAGRPQDQVRNPAGRFQLFRVGDAIASRNIHAAIYDSLRLCKDL